MVQNIKIIRILLPIVLALFVTMVCAVASESGRGKGASDKDGGASQTKRSRIAKVQFSSMRH